MSGNLHFTRFVFGFLFGHALFICLVILLFPQIIFTLWGSYGKSQGRFRSRFARKLLARFRCESRTKWRFALARASRCGAVHILIFWLAGATLAMNI